VARVWLLQAKCAYSPYAGRKSDNQSAFQGLLTLSTAKAYIFIHIIDHLTKVHLLELTDQRAHDRAVEAVLDLVKRRNRPSQRVLCGVGLVDLQQSREDGESQIKACDG
jgi:hypothetical protein